MRSHELWGELEAESGASLLTVSGGLTLGPPSSAFLREVRALAVEFGIGHENLSSDELRSRFPMFAVDAEAEGYYEHRSGYVRPEAAVQAQLDLAARSPRVELRFGEVVLRFGASPAGVAVTTDQGTYGAAQLVLSAGAWLPELMPELSATADADLRLGLRRRADRLRSPQRVLRLSRRRWSGRWGEGRDRALRRDDDAGWPPAPGQRS
jgi:sarcosine oxidase